MLLFIGVAHASERTFEIPSGVPSRPRPVTAMDMALLRSIPSASVHDGAVAISPDGAHMVFQLYQGDPVANTYRTGWFVAPTAPGGRARYIADGGDIQLRTSPNGYVHGDIVPVSDAKWSPDGRRIAYLSRRGDSIQIWSSNIDGKAERRLTNNDGNVRSFVWDGQRILYEVEHRTREQVQAIRLAEEARGTLFDERFHPRHSLRPLQPQEESTDLWVHESSTARNSPADEAARERFRRISQPGGLLETAQDRTPKYKIQTFATEKMRYRPDLARPVSWQGVDEKIAFLDVVRPEDRVVFPTAVLTALSSQHPSAVKCPAKECKDIISGMWWSADGTEVYFSSQSLNQEQIGVFAWSPATNSVRRIRNAGMSSLERCVPTGDRLICLYSSPTQPEIIVALDCKTGAMATLVDLNPEFQSIRLGEAERIEWSNSFGDPTFGYLLKPSGYQPARRYPLVILTYVAKGFLLASTGGEYPAQLLAENGFMVLAFNRPFSVGWKAGRPTKEDSENVQASLDAVIEILEKRSLIDPERIAITGLSNGTAISFHALTHSKYRFAAAIVSSDSAGEPIGYYLISKRDRSRFREQGSVTFTEHGPDYGGVGPSQQIDRIKTPILFQLPDRELLVSMQSIVALEDSGKPFEAHVFADEYHIKWQPAHRYAVFRRNLQWLSFWLQDRYFDDPMDPDQYARWAAMRRQ